MKRRIAKGNRNNKQIENKVLKLPDNIYISAKSKGPVTGKRPAIVFVEFEK